jgi:hypothetical protein
MVRYGRGMADSWDEEGLRALRSALHTGDGTGLIAMLRGERIVDVLQLAGDAVAEAAARRVPGAAALASDFSAALRSRGKDGDEELTRQLQGALGLAPAPLLRALPVDLEMLGCVLEGDPADGGGHIDLVTGECWPDLADLEALAADDDLDLEDPDRWLRVSCRGSREGYRDMERFIVTLDDGALADRLRIAISGRGAFRRFKDVLAGEPEQWHLFHRFCDERLRGRARAWLASQGYRPVSRA